MKFLVYSRVMLYHIFIVVKKKNKIKFAILIKHLSIQFNSTVYSYCCSIDLCKFFILKNLNSILINY